MMMSFLIFFLIVALSVLAFFFLSPSSPFLQLSLLPLLLALFVEKLVLVGPLLADGARAALATLVSPFVGGFAQLGVQLRE